MKRVDAMVLRARLLVKGSVQGVNYRWFVQQAAKELGIKGWVKNLPDGNVEIECESETEKAYRAFLGRIEANHEGASRIHSIDVKEIKVMDFKKDAEPKHDYFNIEY